MHSSIVLLLPDPVAGKACRPGFQPHLYCMAENIPTACSRVKIFITSQSISTLTHINGDTERFHMKSATLA